MQTVVIMNMFNLASALYQQPGVAVRHLLKTALLSSQGHPLLAFHKTWSSMPSHKRDSPQADASALQPPPKKAKGLDLSLTPCSVQPGHFVFVVHWVEYLGRTDPILRPNFLTYPPPIHDHGVHGVYLTLADANKAVEHRLRDFMARREKTHWEDMSGEVQLEISLEIEEDFEHGSDDLRDYLELVTEREDGLKATIEDLEGTRVGSGFYWDVEERGDEDWNMNEEVYVTVQKVREFDEMDGK